MKKASVASPPTKKMMDLMKTINSDEIKQHVIIYYLPEEEESILKNLKELVYRSPREHFGEMLQIQKEEISIKMVQGEKFFNCFGEDLVVEISNLTSEDIWKIERDYNPETIQWYEEPNGDSYTIYVPLKQIDDIGVKKEN